MSAEFYAPFSQEMLPGAAPRAAQHGPELRRTVFDRVVQTDLAVIFAGLAALIG